MINYGTALQNGWIDDKVNLPGALKYFKVAADENDVLGWVNYAIALESGYNGRLNLPEAIKYYKLVAGSDHSRSVVYYICALLFGYSGAPDPKSAMKYFRKYAFLKDY
jgi:TPR repeat protein